ncbi:MAG: ribosome silencing factor [Nitrospiria bacterium]
MVISKDYRERPKGKHAWDAKDKALRIGQIVRSKHAEEIVLFQVSELTSLADFFVICSAESEPQIRAIAESVETRLTQEGMRPLSVEGREAAHWVLIDYGDVILHIFKNDTRTFYNLDSLWGDAPQTVLGDAKAELPIKKGGNG